MKQIADFPNDTVLSHLPQLLDQRLLRQTFDTYLQQTYPQRGYTIEAITRQKIDYRPQKRCRALFYLQMRDPQGNPQANWFYVNMHPPGAAHAKFNKVPRTENRTATPWQPVSLLPEWDMLIWAFPHDPLLAHLPDVVNSDVIARHINAHAQALGLRAGARCHNLHYRQIKYAPRKRCVLRFDAQLTQPASGPAAMSFYSKTYAHGASRYVFDVLQEIGQTAAGPNAALEVPHPLLHIDGLHTYWQQVWNGRSAARRYDQASISHVVARAACVLASLHRSHLPQLQRADYTADVATEAVEDAVWIGKYLVNDQQRVLEFAERIGERDPTSELPPGNPLVPIHGAFRLSQLLENGERLALIDLDDVGLGDPHFDVAEFIASLHYQYFRRDLSPALLQENIALFLSTYRSLVPWPCDAQRVAWYIAAFLLEKLFSALKNLRYQVLPKLDDYYALIAHYLQKAGE